MQFLALVGLQHKLVAVTPGAAFHGGGQRTEQLDVRVLDGFGQVNDLLQKGLRRLRVDRLATQQGKMARRRQTGGFSFFQGGAGKGFVAFVQQQLQQRVLGMVGLDQDFTGFFRAPGAPRYLGNQLREVLGGAKVGAEQGLVGIENADQGQIGKVMALGQHLCADQNAAFTTVRLLQFFLQAAFGAGAVTVDAADPGIGKILLQELLDTFGAGADGQHIVAAAVFTVLRCRALRAAMVATQFIMTFMIGHMRVAALALTAPATVMAHQ